MTATIMKQHPPNFLTCNLVRSLQPPEQFAAYALAYLDSAQRLCTTLAVSHKRATFERGAVVLYLTAHAVELFLKGAILRKAPTERFSHDLEHLHNRYVALYPARRFWLTKEPFKTEYFGMDKAEIAKAKQCQPAVDQLYRYPEDKSGKPWIALLGFEASSYAKELTVLRADFERLLSEYGGNLHA